MKLLLDQNISFRLARTLQDIFPGTAQVRVLGLEDSKDLIIWQYARDNGFVIVTFDADFYDISLLRGTPPKIICLRTGNLTLKNVERLLRANADVIKEFSILEQHADVTCLEIF